MSAITQIKPIISLWLLTIQQTINIKQYAHYFCMALKSGSVTFRKEYAVKYKCLNQCAQENISHKRYQ